jgi:hypothetical protein
MRGEFNQRFGQNSKDRNNMMAHLFPFTDQPATDSDTGVKDCAACADWTRAEAASASSTRTRRPSTIVGMRR